MILHIYLVWVLRDFALKTHFYFLLAIILLVNARIVSLTYSQNHQEPTSSKISLRVKGVGKYFVFLQNHRLFFFSTTHMTPYLEEEFKSRTGWREDLPVSLTNCLEADSKSAILKQNPKQLVTTQGAQSAGLWLFIIRESHETFLAVRPKY